MTIEETILKKLERIERILDAKHKSKITWVKVSVITGLTKWNPEQMRKARDNGLVRFRRSSNGMEYLLESIDEKFIKQ